MPTVAPGSRIASPLLARSSPAMILRRVDLPVPLGPTTPILAPCRNDRVTLSRTTLSPWALRTLRSVKTYSAMIGNPTGARVTDRICWRPAPRHRVDTHDQPPSPSPAAAADPTPTLADNDAWSRMPVRR